MSLWSGGFASIICPSLLIFFPINMQRKIGFTHKKLQQIILAKPFFATPSRVRWLTRSCLYIESGSMLSVVSDWFSCFHWQHLLPASQISACCFEATWEAGKSSTSKSTTSSAGNSKIFSPVRNHKRALTWLYSVKLVYLRTKWHRHPNAWCQTWVNTHRWVHVTALRHSK